MTLIQVIFYFIFLSTQKRSFPHNLIFCVFFFEFFLSLVSQTQTHQRQIKEVKARYPHVASFTEQFFSHLTFTHE